jgi:DNA helicase IV
VDSPLKRQLAGNYMMIHEYLADLNQEQRQAVKHGVTEDSAVDAKPLLVIAGAGSGKTKTLAHRVAHLVVNGIGERRFQANAMGVFAQQCACNQKFY